MTESFFRDVDEIRLLIDEFDKNTTSITCRQFDEKKRLANVERNNFLIRQICKQLKLFREQVDPDISATMRDNIHGQLLNKFMNCWKVMREALAVNEERNKDTIRRQYKIVYPQASETDVERVVEIGGDVNVFAQEMIRESDQALLHVESKHRGIKKLEQSIEELNQLFIEMSILVDQQQQNINHIESNVSSARDFTAQANTQLVSAATYQKKSRRKTCVLCCIIFAIIIITIAISTSLTSIK